MLNRSMAPVDRRILPLVLFSAVIVITFVVYWPGLSGPFIFDDFVNLDKLGELGGVRDWETFRAFVFSGTSGPTGRPVALLSFLLNAQDWPADPFWFKFTNLLIHALTGALIGLVSYQISSLIDSNKHSALPCCTAILTAAIWLLHPFLLSTTLYVVQRMAQLAAMFSLAGMAVYLYGRKLLGINPAAGYGWMSAAVILGTCAATFSKENGALLPALLLMLEITVIASCASIRPLALWWKSLFLVAPTLAIFGYLAMQLLQADPWQVSPHRGFSRMERLFTEGRILVEYLRHWFIPELYTSSVFNDQYPKSTGLFSPITTALAWAFHVAFIVAVFVGRKRVPLLAFAVLFFYAGHLIESTTVPLELYFEHRNYLPAAFLMLPFSYYIVSRLNRGMAVVVAVAILSMLVIFSRYSAGIWSSYDNMALAWAHKSPESVRAQQQASMVLYNQGRISLALDVVDRFLKHYPDNYYMHLWKVVLSCKSNVLDLDEVQQLKQLAKRSTYDLRTFNLHKRFVELVPEKACDQVSLQDVRDILNNLLEQSDNANPSSARYAQIQYLLGRVASYSDEPQKAVDHFQNSLSSRSGPDEAMNMAAVLASEGYYKKALELSDTALQFVGHDSLGPTGQSAASWRYNIREFQRQLDNEMESRVPHPPEKE